MATRVATGIAVFLVTILTVSGTAIAADTGSISGKIVLNGEVPAVETIEINKDTEKCGTEKDISKVVVGEGKGLQWAVVTVEGAEGTRPIDAEQLKLNQEGCQFDPHVVIVPSKTDMKVLNSDGILHNVHTYSEANIPINVAQPGFLPEIAIKFAETEIIKVTCDVHSWMTGYIVVTDTPFVAVTDASGSFNIEGLKPGNYKLRIWHEVLGEMERDVTVESAGDAQVTVEMAMK